MFGSTTLVDSNGAPVVKVVIGSQAQPSDGVAAALIAGAIISQAYSTQTLTAQVTGAATCGNSSMTNASTSGGTCSISNQQATLDITVPGTTAAGAWTGDNLIGDYLDRTLLDRAVDNTTTAANGISGYSLGASDTTPTSNPFTNGAGTSGYNSGSLSTQATGNSNAIFLYQISGANMASLGDQTITDPQSGQSYVEHQYIWLNGYDEYNSNNNADAIDGYLDFLAYSLKFDGPGSKTVGIPVCDNSFDGDYGACTGTDAAFGDTTPTGTSTNDETASHKLPVYFLGQQWIISSMTPPQCLNVTQATTSANPCLTSENTLVNGGDVQLAQESQSGVLNVGDSLAVGNLKFQLQDLVAISGSESAIISIMDANGNVLKQDTVAPGETTTYTLDGQQYKFHVYTVAPGYTFGAKWADVAIYSNTLDLQDGAQLDQTNGDNPDYQVSLGWKNLDGAPGSQAQENPDALRTIVIWANQNDIQSMTNGNNGALNVDQSVPLVQAPVVWRLGYAGLDLTSADMQSLTMELETSTPETVYLQDGISQCTINTPYMQVESQGTGDVFAMSAAVQGGQSTNNEFYVALNGLNASDGASCVCPAGDTTTQCASLPASIVTNNATLLLSAGSVFMAESSSDTNAYGFLPYIGASNLTPATYIYNASSTGGVTVDYSAIGDGTENFQGGGVIQIERTLDLKTADGSIGQLLSTSYGGIYNNGSAPAGGNWPQSGSASDPSIWFAISEKAGVGSSSQYSDYFLVPVAANTSTPDLDFEALDNSSNTLSSSNNEIDYAPARSTISSSVAAGTQGPMDGISTGVTTEDNGYISERGSEFESISSTEAQFNMATQLGEAQWTLSTSGANTTTSNGTTTVTLAPGASTNVGDVTVKLDSITQDVGACSAVGAASGCTPDMSGVSAVIMPNNAATVNVAVPYNYSSYGNLVILDQDAVGVNTLISVGGDQVNSVTASLLQGSNVDWTATPTMVKEVVQGSKIVVAGATAADTLQAAQQFVSELQQVS